MKRCLGGPAVALVLLAGCGGDHPDRPSHTAAPGAGIERIVVGRGAGAATVLRRADAGPRPPGVAFLHGWGAVDPAAYAPWIHHLVAEGREVVLPRYQLGAIALPSQALPDAVRGLRAALRRAPVRRGSLVLAGHSAGGALSADIAAVARARGLPRPCAILAVYPGRRLRGIPLAIPRQDLARIPAATIVVAIAGAHDDVVGTATARDIVNGVRHVPPARRRFVLERAPALASHSAPQHDTPAARRAFWAPLDRLSRRCAR